MHLRKHLRPTLSTLAGMAIASGIVGIIGSGVAGLIAGSAAHKDRASNLVLVSTAIGITGFAGAITLSMTHPED
jgi:hypothetical protein